MAYSSDLGMGSRGRGEWRQSCSIFGGHPELQNEISQETVEPKLRGIAQTVERSPEKLEDLSLVPETALKKLGVRQLTRVIPVLKTSEPLGSIASLV